MRRSVAALALAAALLAPRGDAAARSPGDPIRLVFAEGDVAGTSSIFAPDGKEIIGFIEFRQHRKGDVLSMTRVAHFRDGSSDEDTAEARVAGTLEAISGRSIVRDTHGVAVADVTIDVAGGRLKGTWGSGKDQQSKDEEVKLPKGTYWGALVYVVLKNFEANAEDGHLVFTTVAPTPQPRVIDLELSRKGPAPIERMGTRLATQRFELSPTIHWAVDPILRRVLPGTTFWVLPGEPPALVRYAGPRNYLRQEILIQ